MRTISPLQAVVNAANSTNAQHTVAEVIAWVEAQSKKADMGATSARLRITALNQMNEQIAEDEPRNSAVWLMENIDQLRQRWARRYPDSSAETAETYSSRARTTIAEYLRWAAAPDKYKFNSKPGAKVAAKAADKKEKKVAPVPTPAAGSAIMPKDVQPTEARNFPLGDGQRVIHFALPAGGVTFTDVRKFAVHLFTLATDFNISDPNQAKTFAMVVRGEGNE